MLNHIALAILIVLALALQPAEAGKLRLGIMPSSTHWDSSKDYNERHDGLLAEARLYESDWWAGAMKYENSFDDTSNAYYLLRDNPIDDWPASWGYMLGAVTGYNEDRPMLFGAFTFTLHLSKHAKQRTVIIPLVVQSYQAYVEF